MLGKFNLCIIYQTFVVECDEELFEDNPDEYIRRDIEGSDIDTRRRAACDLVKALCTYFEPQVIGIFTQYVAVSLIIKTFRLGTVQRNAS